MQGTSYEFKSGDPRRSPFGQLPVIVDQGAVVADSAEIVKHLRQTYGGHVDDWLSEEQWGEAFLLEKTIEEYLYFLLLYQRWLLPQNFKIVARGFFSQLPFLARKLLPLFVQYGARQRVLKQGLERRADEEIEQLARECLDVVSARLGEKEFFLGDKPCYLDASAFGFLTNILIPDFPQGIVAYARGLQNLVDYERRFRERYFSDFVD